MVASRKIKEHPMIDPALRNRVRKIISDGGSSSYYELPKDCQQLQDIISGEGMTFSQGNIFKATYRWDKKPDLEYNLRKIIWFAQYELDRIYANDPENPRHDQS